MEPSCRNGDRLLIRRLTNERDLLHRGVVVVLRYPPLNGDNYIKRVVGLPAETLRLEAEGIVVNGAILNEAQRPCGTVPSRYWGLEWNLGDGEYFVLGDQRDDSWDSKRFGPVRQENIRGVPWLRYWPLHRMALVR